MRIVVALGGNALLERGEAPDADIQEHHVGVAARALAPLVQKHDVVITHGNGPQVGLLALESGADPALARPYPFDSLVAETQGLIGSWLLEAVEHAAPGHEAVCLLTRTQVDAADPAFSEPTKFVGRPYTVGQAKKLTRQHGWAMRQDGTSWRRVVASPEPTAIIELEEIRSLLETGRTVICAGGGGVPVVRDEEGDLRGVDAVVDKDLTTALLAARLQADALLLLTDVANVQRDYGTPSSCAIEKTTVEALRGIDFASGSMGPKVEGACRFRRSHGRQSGHRKAHRRRSASGGRGGNDRAPECVGGAGANGRSQPISGGHTMTTSAATATPTRPRVVVGVDGSATSLKAHATGRGPEPTQSQIDVVAVWKLPTSLSWSGPFPSDFSPDTSAEQMLDHLIERKRADHPDLAITGRVMQGDPANVLESASRGAALLVVAQRGHSELVGFLLGSVSKHRVTHAYCPVLVFRDDESRTSAEASS